eukprot:Cvel_8758.t1-p1 / transcript=Cvel_8758.t1 / gene=Cvel_8758 / organism=Chromera_velia_CCMP2878 / gene_product=hypothetical protein / transcript_product=hypothetical protein / location=Cvel_scaffold490:79-731(-) / protein_length=124 / sequence_SO=supercontig / SO=protein_coding / is_pseudo=false
MLACNVFVSEGRNQRILSDLKEIIQRHSRGPAGPRLVFQFTDKPYNRTNFLLAAEAERETDSRASPLSSAVFDVVSHALQHLDLSRHEASHPRIGVVDHISVHPLGDASLVEAMATAQKIGKTL